MKRESLSKATLGRMPIYLRYLRAQSGERVSAAEMARVLNLGEVMVRKDLSRVCSQGRPKIGYPRQELVENLEDLLGARERVNVVVAGAGKLGRALIRYPGFEDFGLVYLAEGDNGMRHISTTNRPINSAEDVKGLKIRVPESQLYLDVWSALGATPIGLALPELAPALANGTAEGQDNATYHLVANATYDSIKYFSNINYMWMGCTMAVNSVKWNSLAPEVQDILKEQAKVAAKYSFDTIAQDNETATKVLQDAGVEFNFEPDVQSFKDALGGDEYYKRYEGESWYSQELLDAILAVVR